MDFEAAPNLDSPALWIEATSRCWLKHPLRSKDVEANCSIVDLFIHPGNEYITHWGEYPLIHLDIDANDSSPNEPFLYHELAHIIDRHDIIFTGGASPGELTIKIDALPHSPNESVRTAFRIMWDAYIDGRLSRHGIFVFAFEYRHGELLSSRKNEDLEDPEETVALQAIWNNEPQTFEGLVATAARFPVRRAPRFRIP